MLKSKLTYNLGIGISLIMLALGTSSEQASAINITGATLTGPKEIRKDSKATYTWTLMGNGAGGIIGTPFNWSVFDQDDGFFDIDDVLIDETASVVTDDALGNFKLVQEFELNCTSDCEVRGKDGGSGEGKLEDPAEVFVLFEGKFGGDLAMTNIIDVTCVPEPSDFYGPTIFGLLMGGGYLVKRKRKLKQIEISKLQ